MATIATLSAAPRTGLRIRLALLLCALGLTTSAAVRAQEGSDPRIGTWVEQRISPDFDSLLRVFEPAEAGKIRMIVNAKLLEANRWHVDFSCDGGKYRILTQDGKISGITYSCRRTGPRTFEFSSARTVADSGAAAGTSATGDWVTAAGTETVSDDGKSYEATAVLSFADGHQRTSRRRFVRRV